MANHIAIGEVHHNKVELTGIDACNQFVFNLVSAHFGLQVIGCNLRRCHQCALLAVVRCLAAAVEEERNVSVLLGLGSVQLLQTFAAQIFAQSVVHVLFREQNVHSGESGVVRCHTVVLQIRDGVHSLFRHIFLCQHDGKLFGAVVAVVEEDYNVAVFDAAVNICVDKRLHKLVGILVLL